MKFNTLLTTMGLDPADCMFWNHAQDHDDKNYQAFLDDKQQYWKDQELQKMSPWKLARLIKSGRKYAVTLCATPGGSILTGVFEMGKPVPTGQLSRKGVPIARVPLKPVPGWDHLIGVLALVWGQGKSWLQYCDLQNKEII